MNRAEKYFLHLPNGTHFEKIIETEYGKENIYVSPDGKKHSIPSYSRFDFLNSSSR
jgi:hypothetical protein